MQSLFMDESGDLGFGCGTKYFILAFCAPKQGKALNKAIKNFNAHLIRNGWNQSVEIKATNVWHAEKNSDIPASYAYKKTPEVPMKAVLTEIGKLEGYIEYVCIKLDTVTPGLQKAHTCIVYNFFAWLLLRGPLNYFPTVNLYLDKRNKEQHSNLKFDGYLESKIGILRAEKNKEPINLQIHHYSWNTPDGFKGQERAHAEYGVRGLEAADFVCWAIKRKYENGDDTFYSLIQHRVKWKQALFPEPA